MLIKNNRENFVNYKKKDNFAKRKYYSPFQQV